MRLINADALIKKAYDEAKGMAESHDDFGVLVEWLVDKAPTIEPEPHWIPCSERLPEEYDSIWSKAKGTSRWSKAMWVKQSDEVIVTELFEDGTIRTDTACTHDGEWYVKIKAIKREIIAWMPLPEPYEEG